MADKDQSRRNQLRHQKAARTQENIQKLRQRTQHIAFDLTLRVAIYARQSTFIQMERNEQSFEDQTEGQRKRALALGWREDQIDVITVDMDYTATTDIDDREGLSELLHQIKQGVYGAVIAYMEDRLFRDEFLDNATRFARACATNNCYLITERYTYDLSDEMERERFLMEVRFGWRSLAFMIYDGSPIWRRLSGGTSARRPKNTGQPYSPRYGIVYRGTTKIPHTPYSLVGG